MDGGSTDDAGGRSFACLGSLERWRPHWQIGVLCVAFCGSVLLNAVLLIAFIRKPGLRTISNRFVMNLIASNIISAVILTGLLIVGTCDGSTLDYNAVSTFCALSEGATAFVTTSSILSVLLIGVDQYLAVVDPLRYRTRIDKLKCALLILGVWLIALLFAGLASLNPQPRGLWRLCSSVGRGHLDDDDILPASSDAPTELTFQASLVLRGNASESANLEIQGAFSLRDQQLELYNATGTMVLGNATDDSQLPPAPRSVDAPAPGTYGLLYALAYAFLGYLLPFLAICWIYVSIYTAARSNSERTRRTGSRPILSSSSLNEDAATPGQPSSLEDFRRIAKISSLSSIDENSEALTPDPTVEEELVATTVLFTVGSSKLEADANAKESDDRSNVPTAPMPVNPERPEPHRGLMYEEMIVGCERHPYEYEDDELGTSSDEEEEEEDDDGEAVEDHRNAAHHCDFVEAQPLSVVADPGHDGRNCSARSISVNFDLGDGQPEEPLQAQPQHVAAQPPPIVTITPPAHKSLSSVSLHKSSSGRCATGGYINNLKYRISNGSLFKYREETRAARISAFVIVMGLICWTPYVYVLLVHNLVGESLQDSGSSAASLDSVALGFLLLATYVSPLLFGYRSRRIKRELRKFFCFRRELSYKNNRSLMAKKVLRRRHSGATVLGQFPGGEASLESSRYSILNCVYGRNRWPKDKVQFVQVPDGALAVETCRSSFSSGASTQISSTSTDEC